MCERNSILIHSIKLPINENDTCVEFLTAFAGTSTVKSVLYVLLCLRSINLAWFLYCATPSGTTGNVTSMASPAIADIAVTFIVSGPVISGVIKNES